jgi:hypothetical protein
MTDTSTPSVSPDVAPDASSPEMETEVSHEMDPSSDGDYEETQETEEMTPAQKKKFKLKIYDEEREYDEDEVVRYAQKAAAADKRFQEAANLEKRYQGIIEKLKTDPWQLFQALEMDPEQAAEQLLLEKLRYEQMTPEQKEALEYRKKYETAQQQLQRIKEMQEEEQTRLVQEQYNVIKSNVADRIDQEIVEAIQSAGIKHKTPALVRRIATKMLTYQQANGGEMLDAKSALRHVMDETKPELQEFLETLSPEDLGKLSPTFLDAVRRHFLGQVQAPFAKKQTGETTTTEAPRPRRVKTSTDDFFNLMEKRFT